MKEYLDNLHSEVKTLYKTLTIDWVWKDCWVELTYKYIHNRGDSKPTKLAFAKPLSTSPTAWDFDYSSCSTAALARDRNELGSLQI